MLHSARSMGIVFDLGVNGVPLLDFALNRLRLDFSPRVSPIVFVSIFLSCEAYGMETKVAQGRVPCLLSRTLERIYKNSATLSSGG